MKACGITTGFPMNILIGIKMNKKQKKNIFFIFYPLKDIMKVIAFIPIDLKFL
jgi:hypothetical protein